MSTVLKVATWNVNSLRTRLGLVLAWIDANQPDVLCLQETKVEDSLFPVEPFTQRGYNIAMHGQKSYNGVAIASKHALEAPSLGFSNKSLPDIFHAQTRLIAASVKGVRIICAYVPNGESPTSEKFAFKENYYNHLTQYVNECIAEHPKLVICGDFNIAAEARDIDRPEKSVKNVLFTPAEQEWLATFRSTNKLADSFREVDQTENVYSWWDYRTFTRAPNNGARIDYLFTSEALTPSVQAVTHHADERLKTQPSDHIPVELTLAL
jgi:exodeoxyribonuclease-3